MLIVIVTVIGGVAWYAKNNNPSNFPASPSAPSFSQKATISGTFNINGVVPQGATITVSQRLANTKTKYKAFATGIEASDKSTWNFNNAISGKSYEIQATLKSGGKTIARSDPMYVTAPADEEVITLDVESSTATGDAVVSGNVGINGYIPDGATITIQARKLGAKDFAPVAQGIAAKDEQTISYRGAKAGVSYEMQAVLMDKSGTEVGSSDVLDVTAPATDEEMHINSTAKAPATPTPAPTVPNQPTATPVPAKGVISGTINFNGAALPNSRIVIFQSPQGSSNYEVAVDNISPQDGTSWQWTGAAAGSWYNLIAILKQRQSNGTDKDIANSNTLTIPAPAANETFTINSGYTLPAAGGSISVNCGNKTGTNWAASVSFQSIPGAGSYWYQIGTTNGGVELTNFTQNATNNPTQSFNYNLQDGMTYYARYAYATVQNLNAGSSQFAPFSSTNQLRCSS